MAGESDLALTDPERLRTDEDGEKDASGDPFLLSIAEALGTLPEAGVVLVDFVVELVAWLEEVPILEVDVLVAPEEEVEEESPEVLLPPAVWAERSLIGGTLVFGESSRSLVLGGLLVVFLSLNVPLGGLDDVIDDEVPVVAFVLALADAVAEVEEVDLS